MDEELLLTRKITKLVKTWSPVLLLMGLLIAVDSFDSVHGEGLLSTMKHSIGFGTHQFHLELPAQAILSSNNVMNDHIRTSELWKARHLLQRHTPPGANSVPVTPQFGLVPPPPQTGIF